MVDVCVKLDGAYRNPSRIGAILGSAGINIEGLCLATQGEATIIHFVVEESSGAIRALEEAGIEVVGESEVFVLDKDRCHVTGRPGSFGHICETFAEHGIRILFGYPAENNRFVFGLDDVRKAGALFEM